MIGRPLLLSPSLQLRQRHAPLPPIRHVAHIAKVDRRHEARRLPRHGDFGVQLVDLLQRQALGLVDAAVDEDHADEAEPAPDEEHLGLQIRVAGARIDHVRRRVRNRPVEQPVRGRCDGEASRARLQREQLPRHHPCHGAPGAGEEEDVQTDERDQDLVGHDGRGDRTDDRHDQLRHAHACRAEQQQRPTAPFLDHVEPWECRRDVDDAGDEGDDEGVLDSGVLEERCAVVD